VLRNLSLLKGFVGMQQRKAAIISEGEERICSASPRKARHIDLVSREAVLPISKVLELLLSLELRGVVRQSMRKDIIWVR
jgi:predicted Rossmann fold nucleotide-binding protein DprA/Smf involved in DNA uptake